MDTKYPGNFPFYYFGRLPGIFMSIILPPDGDYILFQLIRYPAVLFIGSVSFHSPDPAAF